MNYDDSVVVFARLLEAEGLLEIVLLPEHDMIKTAYSLCFQVLLVGLH